MRNPIVFYFKTLSIERDVYRALLIYYLLLWQSFNKVNEQKFIYDYCFKNLHII